MMQESYKRVFIFIATYIEKFASVNNISPWSEYEDKRILTE